MRLFARASSILFPRDPNEVAPGEPPTPTIAHVRSVMDLTNNPSYPALHDSSYLSQ
uniref:Orf42 n=1 Tax=Gymnosphaera podophylla TaxID=204585 RepID=A0A344AIS0_9MONI|nr:orf42 [Alsophila podophylla]YP_009502383.1 orf42 [Alsophila podophylla]AWV63411.1 orf42 [Alsophila podophylla]AWV63434.1 orf42 [Alsophila podophylla]